MTVITWLHVIKQDNSNVHNTVRRDFRTNLAAPQTSDNPQLGPSSAAPWSTSRHRKKTSVKRIYQFVEITSQLREIAYHMRSHSVICHRAAVTFPSIPQPKLVLDYATPERCKAELTSVVVISQDSLFAKDGHLTQKNNQVGSWSEIEPATESRESDVLTTTPAIHHRNITVRTEDVKLDDL